jgi:hypothetical protein
MDVEKSLIDEAAEIAAIVECEEDIESMAHACRVAVQAIEDGETDWLGDVDPHDVAERLTGDIQVFALAQKMYRLRNGGAPPD